MMTASPLAHDFRRLRCAIMILFWRVSKLTKALWQASLTVARTANCTHMSRCAIGKALSSN